MIPKYAVVLIFAAVAAASIIPSEKQFNELVSNHGDSSHLEPNARYHLVIGDRVHGDALYVDKRVQGSNGWRGGFYLGNDLNITCIIVADMNEAGNGDYPLPLEGGIGKQYVEFQFFSATNEEVDFLISIYAH